MKTEIAQAARYVLKRYLGQALPVNPDTRLELLHKNNTCMQYMLKMLYYI